MTHGVTEDLDMVTDLIIHGTEILIIVLAVTMDGIITPDGIMWTIAETADPSLYHQIFLFVDSI